MTTSGHGFETDIDNSDMRMQAISAPSGTAGRLKDLLESISLLGGLVSESVREARPTGKRPGTRIFDKLARGLD